MLFKSILSQRLQACRPFVETACPGFLVVESFDNLRRDCILFFLRQRLNASKCLLKQASHTFTIAY